MREECLNIHRLVFHRKQNFEEGHKQIEYSCKKENEKLKCRTLIETNILGEPKYREKKGNKYSDIESFQNRMSISEIEIRESLKKIKGNIISPREERRAIKVRITNKSYQTNNEEECKERQMEREEVTEEEPLFNINHIYDDKNSSVEL